MLIEFSILIVIGSALLIMRENIVNNYQKINRNQIPREIHLIRLIIASIVIILAGITGIIVNLIK